MRQLLKRSVAIVLRIVAVQTASLAVLAAVSYVCFGAVNAVSMILGGACYIIPTLAAALLLKWSSSRPMLVGAAFIGSSGIKTVFSAILLVLCVLLYPELQNGRNFMAFLIGLLTVSHLVFLIFLKVNRYGG